MKTYTIRDGFTFRDEGGGVKGGGETIDLEDDVAQQHLHKLEEKTSRKKAAPKALSADGGGEGGAGEGAGAGTEPT